MALIISQNDNTRTIGVDRSRAISDIVAERRKVVPIEKSGDPPAETPMSASADNAPVSPSADKPAAATPGDQAAIDPKYLIEIERRERALDAERHAHELAKRELEGLKSRFTSPEDALRAAGFTPEKFIEHWLGAAEGKPSAPASAAAPEQSVLEKRLAQLEAERDQANERSRQYARRQEIEALVPADSEDYAALNGLREYGAIDQLIAEIDRRGQGRQGGLGPQEVRQLVTEFEGNSRKNLQAQVGKLAKSKWGRTLLTELLQGSIDTKAPSDRATTMFQPPETSEDPYSGQRSMSLRGRAMEDLRNRVKDEYLRRAR